MTKYVYSDPHFFHKNILKFQPGTRLYRDVQEMNWKMIKGYNDKVGPFDEVYCLGDFSFGNLEETLSVLDQLNGIKHLILGNHDQVITKNFDQFKASSQFPNRFRSIKDYLRLKHKHERTEKEFQLVLFHFPMLVWDRSHHGSMMLHGHCHGNITYPYNGRIMDVGVDCHPKNEPFAFEEVIDLLERKEYGTHHA